MPGSRSIGRQEKNSLRRAWKAEGHLPQLRQMLRLEWSKPRVLSLGHDSRQLKASRHKQANRNACHHAIVAQFTLCDNWPLQLKTQGMRDRHALSELCDRFGFDFSPVAGFLRRWRKPMPADDWPGWGGPKRDLVWRETGIVEKLPTDRTGIAAGLVDADRRGLFGARRRQRPRLHHRSPAGETKRPRAVPRRRDGKDSVDS